MVSHCNTRGPAALSVRGLAFAYGERTLWSDVSFDAPAGAVTGILGNNGTGKSTLMNCIAGILKPRCGSVMLGGADVLAMNRRERDYAVVEETMRELGILAWAERDASTLSGGEGQKVMLARAVAQEPEVMLLDEPTASLDLAARMETLHYVRDYARSRGTTVLMVSHDVNAALEFCSDLVLIEPAGAVHGTSVASVTNDELSRTYGIPVTVRSLENHRFVCAGAPASRPRL